jgi:hypothetical protein
MGRAYSAVAAKRGRAKECEEVCLDKMKTGMRYKHAKLGKETETIGTRGRK